MKMRWLPLHNKSNEQREMLKTINRMNNLYFLNLNLNFFMCLIKMINIITLQTKKYDYNYKKR